MALWDMVGDLSSDEIKIKNEYFEATKQLKDLQFKKR